MSIRYILKSKGAYPYEVKPVAVIVDEVIHGAASEKEIAVLQHADHAALHKGDEVILILARTTDGRYWSYMPDDGIPMQGIFPTNLKKRLQTKGKIRTTFKNPVFII